MVAATTNELKALGVPFFGIPQSSFAADKPSDKPSDTMLMKGSAGAISGGDEKKLGRSEVVELQKRMLELLEDLCRD